MGGGGAYVYFTANKLRTPLSLDFHALLKRSREKRGLSRRKSCGLEDGILFCWRGGVEDVVADGCDGRRFVLYM